MGFVCDICLGTEIIKDNGEFVCKKCGCRYSIADVRKMLNIVIDNNAADNKPASVKPVLVNPSPVAPSYVNSAPVTSVPVNQVPVKTSPVNSAPVTQAPATPASVNSTPVTQTSVKTAPVNSAPVTQVPVTPASVNTVSGSISQVNSGDADSEAANRDSGSNKVENPNEDLIRNYLNLSNNAYISGNGSAAYDYANKVLELKPACSDAWIAKMKSLEFLGGIGNFRVPEIVDAGNRAINSSENKQETAYTVYFYELTRALDLLKLATNKMCDTADVVSAYQSFKAYNYGNVDQSTLQYDQKFVNLYDATADDAMTMATGVPYSSMKNYFDMASLANEVAKQYRYETDALARRYSIYGASLLESSVKIRIDKYRSLSEKANNAIKEAEKAQSRRKEEEHKKEVDDYWKEHVKEKNMLVHEKDLLTVELDELRHQVDSIRADIDNARKEKETPTPTEKNIRLVEERIEYLQAEKNKLGVFKTREKEAYEMEIQQLRSQQESMKEIARAEAANQDAIYKNKIQELKLSANEKMKEQNEKQKRIVEIKKLLNLEDITAQS